ncbi:MAG: disulfide bond formation protein B [Acidimicrobiales bacterium]
MSTDAVTLFFALLAVVVQLAVVATLVALVAGGANVRSRLVDTIGPDATKLALAIATTATLGSLYLSEVANFIPCRLCWIQRGFMYPLVPLLALAEWRRIAILQRLGLLLAGVGAGVSIYHVLLERLPQRDRHLRSGEPLHLDLGEPLRVPHHPHHGARVGCGDHHAAVAALVVQAPHGLATPDAVERTEEPRPRPQRTAAPWCGAPSPGGGGPALRVGASSRVMLFARRPRLEPLLGAHPRMRRQRRRSSRSNASAMAR